LFQKWQIFDIKKYCQKNWQMFWKTDIFGNISQIWHHLATLGLPNLFSVAGHFHMRKFITGHERFFDLTISFFCLSEFFFYPLLGHARCRGK